MRDAHDVGPRPVDLAVQIALDERRPPARVARIALEREFHDVAGGDERRRERPRHQKPLRVARVAHGDVPGGVEHALVGKNAACDSQLFRCLAQHSVLTSPLPPSHLPPFLFPRHDGDVDGAGRAFSAHRLDRDIYLRQPEPVRRQEVERIVARGEQLKAHLHGAIRVAARALQRDALPGEASDREIGERRVPSPCTTSVAARRFAVSIASSIGPGPPPEVQSTATSTPRPPVIC